MEIRVLKYFLTVVREESITKASEVLHITQPTLSRQLAQMEEELGVKLIDRGTRKIRLTNEGMLLRRRAEEIIQLVDKTEQELLGQNEQVEGKITIGCGEIAPAQLLSDPTTPSPEPQKNILVLLLIFSQLLQILSRNRWIKDLLI